MNCSTAEERMELLLQGGLADVEARALRDHLASCPRCLSGLGEAHLAEILPAIDPEIEPSAGFHDRFLLRLQNHRAQARSMEKKEALSRRFWAWSWMHKLALAGALAAVLGFVIYTGLQSPEVPVAGPSMMGEITVAENLPLLKDMSVIENLDLLEDFDAIENLNEGRDATSVH